MTDSKISVTHGGTYTPDGLTPEDVMAELEANGITDRPIQQFSQDAIAAAIVIVGFLQANGIGQIAQMIEAVAHRNDGKSIRVKMDDDEFEATGDTQRSTLEAAMRIPEDSGSNRSSVHPAPTQFRGIVGDACCRHARLRR